MKIEFLYFHIKINENMAYIGKMSNHADILSPSTPLIYQNSKLQFRYLSY
jgi:hypothetical protein